MNQDFQIRHESKHYRPCNQYKHHFHRSHHRSLLDGRSVKIFKLFIILFYPLAGLFEYLLMFWLRRHLPAKQAINSKQSTKEYERIIRDILRRSGYFTQFSTLEYTITNTFTYLVQKISHSFKINQPLGVSEILLRESIENTASLAKSAILRSR